MLRRRRASKGFWSTRVVERSKLDDPLGFAALLALMAIVGGYHAPPISAGRGCQCLVTRGRYMCTHTYTYTSERGDHVRLSGYRDRAGEFFIAIQHSIFSARSVRSCGYTESLITGIRLQLTAASLVSQVFRMIKVDSRT